MDSSMDIVTEDELTAGEMQGIEWWDNLSEPLRQFWTEETLAAFGYLISVQDVYQHYCLMMHHST